jgi:hypothetical protein
MHNASYQDRLALDYLLASKGGVCRKFNLSNCCLQIDDKEKIIKGITDKMRMLAHVPVQTGRGWDPNDLFWRVVFCLRWIQNSDRGNRSNSRRLILPCLAPLVLRSIRTIMESVIGRKTAAYVMMLWKYKSLDQGDAI